MIQLHRAGEEDRRICVLQYETSKTVLAQLSLHVERALSSYPVKLKKILKKIEMPLFN
jgi:hypothetical protein